VIVRKQGNLHTNSGNFYSSTKFTSSAYYSVFTDKRISVIKNHITTGRLMNFDSNDDKQEAEY